MLLTGTIIDRHYEIITLLGEGGMCAVYKARHLELQRDVALKILHRRLITDSNALERFRHEAVSVNKLEDPHIVKVYGFGVYEQAPYMAMEYIEGISLAQLLKERGRLSLQEALPIFNQILDALAKAHAERIIHRDLKPSNVMLTGPDNLVKVVDFGIAKILPDTGNELQKLTQTGQLFGTTIYMSPEQCRGEPLDARSDIYSMGCLMYETLDGAPPIQGDTAFSTLNKHLNDAPRNSAFITGPIGSVIEACLEKDANRRPASAGDLQNALANPEAWLQSRSAIAGRGKGRPGNLLSRRAIGIGAVAIAIVYVLSRAQQRPTAMYDPGVAKSMSEDALREGRELVNQKKYPKGIARLTEAINYDSQSAFAYYFRGTAYNATGEAERAEADFTRVIALKNPATGLYLHYDPYRLRGLNRRAVKNFPGALADFNEALQIAPHERQLYEERAMTYFEMGKLDQAWADLNRSRQEGADNAPLFRCFGLVESARGHHQAAYDDFTTAINKYLLQRADPGDDKLNEILDAVSACYKLRADQARELGKVKQASADSAEAARLDRRWRH